MKSIVVAPHPDDEVLGVGGTLLRRKAEGGKIAWLIVTGITTDAGWPDEKVRQRSGEIEQITNLFCFDKVFALDLPTTELDHVPMRSLVSRISDIFGSFQPDEVFAPHSSDVHTDHRIVFDAVATCTKCFRHPSIKRVLAYETLSETDFALKPEGLFHPTSYVDISPYMERKLALMQCYPSELGMHPFPRSETALRALAQLRGAQSGFEYAEAFHLLRERL